MSYERAMGTDDIPAVTMIEADEPATTPPEEIARRQAEREAERQRELDEMWGNGTWRDGPVFDRWLSERFVPSNQGDQSRGLLFFATLGPRAWLSSAHCVFALPADQECSNNVARERSVAWIALLWPVLTGYYAWRKSSGSKKWTGIGAAAGVATCLPVAWTIGVLTGQAKLSFQY